MNLLDKAQHPLHNLLKYSTNKRTTTSIKIPMHSDLQQYLVFLNQIIITTAKNFQLLQGLGTNNSAINSNLWALTRF